MVLILGAANAGKRDIAKKFYGITDFTEGASCEWDDAAQAQALRNYQILVRRLLDAGIPPQEFTNRYISANPAAVILMDEIGSGIVPLERSERSWREEAGICARIIARNAAVVIRVICGIPQVIKGELL